MNADAPEDPFGGCSDAYVTNHTVRQCVADARSFFDDLTLDSLAPVIEDGNVQVLLLGCGPKLQMPPPDLRSALREKGIGIEPMDTGAACRTYNVLLAEGRAVAAALIAVE